jgi:hypothetical protein
MGQMAEWFGRSVKSFNIYRFGLEIWPESFHLLEKREISGDVQVRCCVRASCRTAMGIFLERE